MSFITLIALSLTIGAWRFAQSRSNDVSRVLASLLSVTCLIVGLTTASVLVKSLILLSVLFYPVIVEKRKTLSSPTPCGRYACSQYAVCPQYTACANYLSQYSPGESYDRYPY